MPAKGARCLTWDCPRKSWAVAGMGSGLSMRARAGDHRAGAPGRCAKASKKDKGRMPARGLLGHGPEPGGRAPAPGGGGRAPTGPWEAGARGQGPQVLLTGALKILQRVWAAGGGVVAVSTSRSPCRCCQACWRGPVSSTASPATNPAVRAGPGGHERGDHRPLSRPGRGPRRARPVHGQGPVPACAAPSRSAGPAGEVEAEPGFFEARHRRPLRSGAQGGVRPDR